MFFSENLVPNFKTQMLEGLGTNPNRGGNLNPKPKGRVYGAPLGVPLDPVDSRRKKNLGSEAQFGLELSPAWLALRIYHVPGPGVS